MMHHANNLISAEQRLQFESQGFLVVPGALSPAFVNKLLSATRSEFSERDPLRVNVPDILHLDSSYLDLIDSDVALRLMCALLGWNIWVNHTHMNIVPAGYELDGELGYLWHRDGGAIHKDLSQSAPLLSIKVGFYLSDCIEPDSGQTYVIPGSHLPVFEGSTRAPDSLPADAVPVSVSSGSAVLFHNRVIHSGASPNKTSRPRSAVFIQWAYRWLKSLDGMTTAHLDRQVHDPIRRQLLGFRVSKEEHNAWRVGRASEYYPAPEEVPLKAFAASNLKSPQF